MKTFLSIYAFLVTAVLGIAVGRFSADTWPLFPDLPKAKVTELHEYAPARPCCSRCTPCRCRDCTLEVESTGEKFHAECFCPPATAPHPNCRCNPCRCKDCDCFCPQCQPKEKGKCPS